jgi:hypothetical protein
MLKRAMRVGTTAVLATAATLTLSGPAQAGTGQEICYQAHVQDRGWLPWACNGAWAGTRGEGKNLEALRVKTNYGEICLRAHRSRYGWDSTEQCAKPGKTVQIGTEGMNAAIEAIEYVERPGGSGGYVISTAHLRDKGDVSYYRTSTYHTGWNYYARLGTTGEARPMEAVRFNWS